MINQPKCNCRIYQDNIVIHEDHCAINQTKTSSKLVDKIKYNLSDKYGEWLSRRGVEKALEQALEQAKQEGFKAGFIKAGLKGERNRIIEQIRAEERERITRKIKALKCARYRVGEINEKVVWKNDILKALNQEEK